MPKSEGTYNSFMINFLIDRKYRVARHLLLILFFVFVSFNLPFLTCAVFLDQYHQEDEQRDSNRVKHIPVLK